MKNFTWLFKLRLKSWKKHPVRLFLVVFIPFISIFIYFSSYQRTTSYTNNISFGIVNEDKGTYTNALITFLKKNIKLKEYPSRAAADDGLSNNDVNAVVYLKKGSNRSLKNVKPKGISIKSLQGDLIEKQGKMLLAAAISKVVRLQRISKDTAEFKKSENYVKANQLTIKQRNTNDQESKNMLTTQIIGFLMMMMLYNIADFAGDVIQNERANHVYYRLLTTPLTKNEYLWGTALSALLIGTVETVLTTLLMKYVFNINAGIPYLTLFGILEVFSLMAVIISMMIGLAVNQRGTGNALQTLSYTITSLLSGTVIPLAIMPDFMQHIAKFMPQYWVVETISSIQKVKNIQIVLTNLTVLLAFILFFFSVTLFVAKHKKTMQFI
ncbi:ABC transporter permease [Liquorilactobacillus oeni]|uniref:ABC transporter permease n=1 Tax=Liquorilactobacillus oeni TaxID=303241 RepID=UPI00070CDF6C|nr:ABC transporter permease [Liquorilactobacillus oeni]